LANNIIDHFDKYFEMIPTTSDELKNEAYKLRYQVFCIENQIFNHEDYPDNLEFDDYDQQSVQYLIRHRESGNYAATTRLILPNANKPENLFPLELYCEINNFAVMQPIDRKHLAEVSRFCVSEVFKRRTNDSNSLTAISSRTPDYFTHDERRTFPHIITFALIACCIKASHENDIHFLYGTLEPSWLRFLSSTGINFTKIGPMVNFHGDRWPAVIKITDLLDGVAEKNLAIWNLLTNKGCFEQVKPREAILLPVGVEQING
jgi:N-acyl amino acid synthase of PEP-CTERM/exosortase system